MWGESKTAEAHEAPSAMALFLHFANGEGQRCSVQIHLLGKQQRQLEDGLYYHAIRQVVVRGTPLPVAAIRSYLNQQLQPSRQTISYTPQFPSAQ